MEPASRQIPRHEWVLRFTQILQRAQPAMGDAVAKDIAARTYPDASHLTPDQAAEIYALEEPPTDVAVQQRPVPPGLDIEEWIERCTRRLATLHNGLSDSELDDAACDLWLTHRHLLPEAAAERSPEK